MSLISTSDLRVWMGIEEGDVAPNAKLLAIANAVEDFVDSFTNRKLEAAVYRTNVDNSYLDGTGRAWIYLPQYPISYITEINIDSARDFGSGTILPTADFFWYPSGKVVSEGGYFTYGRRNVRVDYIAGYAPVVGGTHSAAVSSYPLPYDLQQVMKEMSIESFKEGITAVHTLQNEQQVTFKQMLTGNTFWSNVLNKYKAFDASLAGRDE